MAIDRKYIGVITKADGTVVNDWILFRAKDKCLPATLAFYIYQCSKHGASQEHIDGLTQLLKSVNAYQEAHPEVVKVPDTTEDDKVYSAVGWMDHDPKKEG